MIFTFNTPIFYWAQSAPTMYRDIEATGNAAINTRLGRSTTSFLINIASADYWLLSMRAKTSKYKMLQNTTKNGQQKQNNAFEVTENT